MLLSEKASLRSALQTQQENHFRFTQMASFWSTFVDPADEKAVTRRQEAKKAAEMSLEGHSTAAAKAIKSKSELINSSSCASSPSQCQQSQQVQQQKDDKSVVIGAKEQTQIIIINNGAKIINSANSNANTTFSTKNNTAAQTDDQNLQHLLHLQPHCNDDVTKTTTQNQ